ncbi:MAG: sulfatase, partial [Verrucomicrobiae bacterium]|nr:sulfatase [Verrucomicrobiae bacterium]
MKTLFLSLLCLAGLCLSLSAKPNIVLIIADDATHRDLEVYGGQAKTPRLNQLAKESLKFNQCFQAAPMCSPTRHNLYTGIYPVKSGAYPNHTFVKEGIKSLPVYLKPLGYRVALSGKTHIAPKEQFPFEYSDAPSPDGGNPKGDIDFAAIDQLMKECSESKTPFCLIVASKEPHTPYNRGNPEDYPPESVKLRPYHVDTPEMRQEFSKYLAEITVFDSQVGQTLDLLDKYGLKENTLFLVLTEQGNSFSHAKWSCYEDGVKSGAMVRWPGVVDSGKETNAVIEYVDVVPTFLEVAGADIPAELDGESFLPVLKGEKNTHKEFVFSLHTTLGIQNNAGPFAIRTIRSDRYRYILNIDPDALFQCAVDRTDWFKSWVKKAKAGDKHAQAVVERYRHRPAVELYDV